VDHVHVKTTQEVSNISMLFFWALRSHRRKGRMNHKRQILESLITSRSKNGVSSYIHTYMSHTCMFINMYMCMCRCKINPSDLNPGVTKGLKNDSILNAKHTEGFSFRVCPQESHAAFSSLLLFYDCFTDWGGVCFPYD